LAIDSVPGGGLVALEALIHSSVWLAGNTSRNHLEVHHVVAGGCRMTLGTTLNIDEELKLVTAHRQVRLALPTTVLIFRKWRRIRFPVIECTG